MNKTTKEQALNILDVFFNKIIKQRCDAKGFEYDDWKEAYSQIVDYVNETDSELKQLKAEEGDA